MPSHNWKHNADRATCARCGVYRKETHVGKPKHPVLPDGNLDRSRTLSGYDYWLPDAIGYTADRPSCQKGRGASRSARRNGRRRRVLTASRAGGARLVSREAKLRAERLARLLAEAVAADALAATTALPDATPALTPPEEADAF